MSTEALIKQLLEYDGPTVYEDADGQHIENSGVALCELAAERLLAQEAALSKMEAERNAAISYLRKLNWCAGCIHFKGLTGCKVGLMEECTEASDFYEFQAELRPVGDTRGGS